jgi:hypothetical protein
MHQPNAGRRGARLLSLALLTALAAVGLSSCYPDYNLSPTDYDVVVTKFDDATNFGAYRTFALADTVIHLGADTTGPNAGTDPRLTRKYDQQILDRVQQNMVARGYTYVPGKIDTTNPPSFVLVVAATAQTTVYSYYYYPYYGYWWGYWGWYYPPYVSYDSYSTGTLMINMIDPRKPSSGLGNRVYATVWFAGINGLLNATSAPLDRLYQRIDQAFTQSPYLGAK